MQNSKIELISKVREMLLGKIDLLNEQLNDLKLALEGATKSSAGDKHETSRALVHLEQEKLSSQIGIQQSFLSQLEQINVRAHHKVVGFGSLVFTNHYHYFVSIGVGAKVTLEKESFFIISPSSPIGKLLVGLKEKDSFVFNGQQLTIKQIM